MNPMTQPMGLMGGAQPDMQPDMQPGQPGMQPGMEPGMEGGDLQAKYEDLYAKMTLLLDEPQTFQSAVEMFQQAQQGDMLVPQAAEMVVDVMGRLEKEVGPIEEEVMMQLGEDLISEMEERYGVDLTDDQALQAASAAVALWMKRHPDRVEVEEGDVQALDQGVQQMVQQGGGVQQGAPQGAQQGLIGGA
jgi:hypothetical protein